VILALLVAGHRSYLTYLNNDFAQRRRYRQRRSRTKDLKGEHLALGLSLTKMKQILKDPAFSHVHGFRGYSKELGWMKGQPFFTPEPVEFNSYELCKLAGEFVKGKGKPDYSVAEMSYVDNDAGAGFAKVFVSHYQAELITKTLCTVEGDTELSVTIPDKDELRLMQEKSDEHTLLYERVCDILKGINVEKAGARNPKDRQHLHFALRVLS